MMELQCFNKQIHGPHKWNFLYSGVSTEGNCPGRQEEVSFAKLFNEDLSIDDVLANPGIIAEEIKKRHAIGMYEALRNGIDDKENS